ncbi:MAG TPA: MFS transporter, partial [Vicinamibacterales bacterium]|nr:MFS transporter [Vicinamibacterales bacterium]
MESPPRWRRNVAVAAAASFVGFAGFTLVMPFLPLYFEQLGVHDVGSIAFWSGASLGVTPAVTAVLAPFWGRLADRVGHRLLVLRSLVAFTLVMAAMAFVTRAWHVFALRALLGLFAGYGALTLTMAAESAPPDRLPRAIGAVQTAQRLGPALGPALGGVVAQLVGIRRAFLAAAVCYLIALVLIAALYHDPPRKAERPRGARGPGVRGLLAESDFARLMGIVFGLQLVERSFGPVLPLYLAQLGAPASRVPLESGLLFSAGAAAAALGHHSAGILLPRYAARRLLGVAAGGGTVAVALCALAGPRWLLFIATPGLGVLTGLALTTAYAAAGRLMPPGSSGAGFGLLTTASLLAVASSPVLAGLVGTWSLRAVFLADTLAMAVVAGVGGRLRTAGRRA